MNPLLRSRTWPVMSLLLERSGEMRALPRRSLLTLYAVTVAVSGGVIGLASPTVVDIGVVGVLCAVLLLPLPLLLLRGSWVQRVVFHATTLGALVFPLYGAGQTGGIHSPALIWFSVLVIPVLLLWGGRQALAWFVLLLLALGAMALATVCGWIDGHAPRGPGGVLWTQINHALALGDLMLSMHVYAHVHQLKQRSLERGNTVLEAVHRELAAARTQKDEFVAAVGHELRTPMNAILGFNETLRHELKDHPEQLQAVDHIARSTEHLLYVVNEILEFSQLEAGQVRLHMVDADVHVVLHQALQERQAQAQAKGLACVLEIEPNLPRWFHLDRQRLLQVLGVLLDNAIKFTTEGEIRLKARLTEKGLRCTVRDTGPGIAVALQAQIFKRLERASSLTTRTHDGAGLGLTIGEKLISLQGGTMGVRSLQGRGAAFWFELPARVVDAPAAPAPSAAEPDTPVPMPEPEHILVVDDNAVNLMVAKLQLKRLWPQARIVTASSGREAMIAVAMQAFDVALIDVFMPEMDGLELTQWLQTQFEQQALARFPIMGLTASTQPADLDRCQAAGMVAVLGKPMDGQQIKRGMALIASHQQTQTQTQR